MGRVDARMVHSFAAACVQLRGSPHCKEPPSLVGYQTPGGSRLEVRVAHEQCSPEFHSGLTSCGSFPIGGAWECPV